MGALALRRCLKGIRLGVRHELDGRGPLNRWDLPNRAPRPLAARAALESKIRRLHERGDVIRTMHREPTGSSIERPASNYPIFAPELDGRCLVGRIIGERFSDEFSERRHFVVDGAGEDELCRDWRLARQR